MSSAKPPSIRQILRPGGSLSRELPGYEHRPQQVEACEAVEEAIKRRKVCLIEAGTGVGKSLAYLIPALRYIAAGHRVVVSTHTINLQTQLIEKDLPLVARLFPQVDLRAVLMKGRGRYLCLQDLDAAEGDLFHASDPQFREVKRWAAQTPTGDQADLPFVYPYWHEIAANQDTCRSQECRYFDRCFYFRMRRAGAEANLVVVNHALFLSDLLVRQAEESAAILPDYDLLVLDEAHHLEDVATTAFGLELPQRRIPDLLDRIRRLRHLDLNTARLQALEDANTELFGSFQTDRQEFFLEEAVPGGNLDAVGEAGQKACIALEGICTELLQAAKDLEGPDKERVEGLSRIAGRHRDELHSLLFVEDPGRIRWGSKRRASDTSFRSREPRYVLHNTPIQVGKTLVELLWPNVECAILTSATLANSGGFSYVRDRLGIPEDALEHVIGSPFDFKKQALLYVPRGLPSPPKKPVPEYAGLLADEIERLVKLTEGRAFLLFTSWRMLSEVYDILCTRLEYPLFKQGEMPSGKLLEAFRASGNGCLFGVQSFWEGVDVPGEALSCVVIDRLPFAVPDTPITRARTRAIVERGGDWFREYSIPMAQIRLKQGFGRLIRSRTDRGIVCILDTRLLTAGYGEEFVRYLPPAARASVWSRVERFWHRGAADADPETPEGTRSDG